MPTGYTHAISEGITFPDFALRCARAFGYLVGMREDSLDTQIPEEFEPYPWHKEELNKAQRQLGRIKNKTIGEMLEISKRAAERDHRTALKVETEIRERSRELRKQYEAMLDEVFGWDPPTPDHVELKTFMIEQIRSSIEHDCCGDEDWEDDPELLTPFDHLARRLVRIGSAIDYHTREWNDEVERTRQRNEWIQQLRASLNGSA